MKYPLFIVLLVAVVITAGCVGGNQNTAVTPTQAIINVSTNSHEPIVGIWQWTAVDSSKIYSFTFFSDGRYSYTDTSATDISLGTWLKIHENEYNVTYSNGKTQTFIYNQSMDTFTIPEFSQVRAYRLGKEPVTPIPTIIASPISVSTTYLSGTSTCSPANVVYKLCFDKDVNVSIKNNLLTASGTLLYQSVPPQPVNPYAPYYPDYSTNNQDEVGATANLKIYNNKSVKVAEISKPFTIDKNGKTLIELNTEISENNPIGWTYIISIEKNPDVVTTVTPTREFMDCHIVSSQGHSYGTEYTISGYVKQTGRSGTCIITVELLSQGQSVNSKDTPIYISQGDTVPFSVVIYDPQGTARSYKVSARISW